jgi:hypothetical protein
MEKQNKWDEFLEKATAQEVFSKIGKSITFNEKFTPEQRQLMSEKIWGRWSELKNKKQATIFEKAADPNWWDDGSSGLQ